VAVASLHRHLGDALLLLDFSGHIVYATPSSGHLFGHIVGGPDAPGFLSFVDPAHRGPVGSALTRAMANPGDPVAVPAVPATGGVTDLRLVFEAVEDVPGKPHVVVAARDRTREARLERELLEARQHVRLAFGRSREAMALLDGDGVVLAANRALESLCGDAGGSLVGRCLDHLVRLREGESAPGLLARLAGECGGSGSDDVVRQAGDALMPLGRILLSVAGGGRGWGGRAQACLTIRPLDPGAAHVTTAPSVDLLLRTLMDNAGQVFWITTPDKEEVIYVSRGFEETWGMSRQELRRRPKAWLDGIVAADREAVLRCIDQQGEGGYDLTYRVRRPDGEVRWVRDRSVPLRSRGGAVLFVAGIAEDITRARSREQRYARLVEAVEQLEAGVMITTAQGRIEYVNAAFEDITGFAADDVLGEDPRILGSGEQPADFHRDLWETLHAGRAWRSRFVNRRRNGDVYHQDTTITPIRDRRGAIGHFAAIFRDVSAEVDQRERLEQAQRLSAMGRFAGAIAHDFNNLLQVIRGHTEFVADGLGDAHASAPDLRRIIDATEHARRLTHKILTFSRQHTAALHPLALGPLIREGVGLLRRLLGEDIEIALDLDPDAGPVDADATQVEQLLMNLVVNARDAMPRGGRVSVALSPVEEPGVPEGAQRGVRLTVADTGTGMPAEVAAHVFEPFFTTKAEDEGTGLGLATVYGIVQQMGGTIRIDTRIGEGTAVEMCFPEARARSARP
jgi:PAS domain S-box-containing protein